MTERLTEKIDGGYRLKIPKGTELSDLEIKFAAYDKLGAYEDAEDNGRLFIFPCKIGDVVHVPPHDKYVIKSFEWNYNGGYAIVGSARLPFNLRLPFAEFGKTVFFDQRIRICGDKK